MIVKRNNLAKTASLHARFKLNTSYTIVLIFNFFVFFLQKFIASLMIIKHLKVANEIT